MVPLIYDLGYPAPDEEIKARLGNIINLTDFKTLLAVTEDDDLAGMIGMCESYAYEHDNKYIRVLALVVCKNYRERGIGKLLMMEAEKWASEINAYQIVLTSGLRDERKQAYAFYQRMGYEINDKPGIGIFEPRPSPAKFDEITGDVVFAITGRLLHNYLLPRECPRVTYYATPKTKERDKALFFNNSLADYFSPENFVLLDECAGYYVSYKPVQPISVVKLDDLIDEILKRNVELRFTPNLSQLADAVVKSTLNFSLIRMRNATK
eukprot:gene8350-8436_t